MYEILILFCAGFIAGAINSLAGGGSFISFPALVFVGIPPIAANATNTFASTAGYITGAFGYKKEILGDKKALFYILIFSLIGGSVGAWILLKTNETGFTNLIPWLLLFATLLFIFGNQLNSWLSKIGKEKQSASLLGKIGLKIFLFLCCVYGGFFNAGQGIVNLSYLSLAGHSNIHYMNAIKLFMSAIVGAIASLIFYFNGLLVWQEGLALMIGTLSGGYLAAKMAYKLNQSLIRKFVIIACVGTTIYFFIVTYF